MNPIVYHIVSGIRKSVSVEQSKDTSFFGNSCRMDDVPHTTVTSW